MSDSTVLVIDDSATIRKLVDSHLSPAGYRVILAADADEGLRMASEGKPDLIILDHQLPGATGYEVACRLVESPELSQIPVVVSSTLRKKAYAEYIDLDNVVDMLPKPYTEDLLRTTVANALETAAIVVASQSEGTAVPEVMGDLEEAALSGIFSCFGLRELVDFLNNGRKVGVLQVDADGTRIRIHLDRGRIQGVYASGVDPQLFDEMARRLPKTLQSLGPVFKMTIGGRSCAEIDGFVELLDQKVLDPRLMTKLLRFQAAMLIQIAFSRKLSSFQFEPGIASNSLHRNLPLNISLLALLVEGALYSDDPGEDSNGSRTYARRAIRGQNLDRAGLSARHMKVLNVLSDTRSEAELIKALGWNGDEVRQVLSGFVRAELVEVQSGGMTGQFVVFEPSANAAKAIRNSMESCDSRYTGKVVRDKLALQLVLKRAIPHTLIFAADDKQTCQLIGKLFSTGNPKAAKIKRIAMLASEDPQQVDWNARVGFRPDFVVKRPCPAEELYQAMDQLHGFGAGSPDSYGSASTGAHS